jgi:hypothetical protein
MATADLPCESEEELRRLCKKLQEDNQVMYEEEESMVFFLW